MLEPTDVAVIGLSVRLPKAPGTAAYWRLLEEGTDAITQAPDDRWGPGLPRAGGFIDGVGEFDAEFFGISPREAALMDPQQRLLLELAWEALEEAGVRPSDLRGTRTGIFVGAIWDDYATLLASAQPEYVTRHALTGLNRGMLANRISYALGLRGPSLTVDSAQSSSLVAVHMAVQSLRLGESALALAGGVNLNLARPSMLATERLGVLSPDGRCFTFDARANGYVRGEGGGLVVLKPLARALADGDEVLCVIRGSAVNQDGGGEGLTVPVAEAQRELIEQACAQAGLEPSALQYVELHGTGTRRGDPVEAAALGVVTAGRSEPLLVGSAKTNIGHLEGAAGIAGLAKLVLAIRHRRLPPSLNFEVPNPEIDFAGLNLQVQTALGPWPSPDRPLVAGVSSFGMGGTNCHLVVSAPPRPADRRPAPSPAPGPGPGAVAGVGPEPGGAP